MRHIHKISFLSVMIFLLFAAPGCNDSPDSITDLDTEILQVMQDNSIPSVVACIVSEDSIVWEGTYGDANVSASIPATRHTLYTIMSISKLFLSTTAMQLWEEGLMDLHADINSYLPFEVRNPNFPNDVITPYMLLNHTSGLAWPMEEDRIPDFHHFYSYEEEPPLISEWLPEYILPAGSQYRESVWKNFAPGEKWLYSNIGTSLLALIVENISGEDFRDYCQKNVLEPLEMHNSAYRFSKLNQNLLAIPYTNNNTPIAPYTVRHYPVGFLNCDLKDFSHFVIAILNSGEYNGKRILSQTSIDKMLEIQNPSSGVSYLWWHCMNDCFSHLGGGTGFSTYVEWNRSTNKALFIFSNKVNETIEPGGRIYDLVRYQANNY